MKSNFITTVFLLFLLALLTKFSSTIYDYRTIGMVMTGFVLLVFFMIFFK